MKTVYAQARRVVAFAGAFGSGKTEVAVNFTEGWAAVASGVSIADLDIINLYFRSRQVRAEFEAQGIGVVAPPEGEAMADLPVIVPEVRGALHDRTRRLVLDVGGNDLGAKVLASFRDVVDPSDVDLFLVINANRPFTEDVAGARAIMGKIEEASGLLATGLVSNTHLCDETTVEDVVAGFRMAESLGRAVRLPVRFAAAEDGIASRAAGRLPVPVLALRRRMLTPFHPRARRRAVPGIPLGRP